MLNVSVQATVIFFGTTSNVTVGTAEQEVYLQNPDALSKHLCASCETGIIKKGYIAKEKFIHRQEFPDEITENCQENKINSQDLSSPSFNH